jgi:Cu+-exporting ATPase
MATQTVTLPISGMTCANCVMNIERTLNKRTPGVARAAVNFAAESAAVAYFPGMTGVGDIVAAIEKAGFGAIIPK